MTALKTDIRRIAKLSLLILNGKLQADKAQGTTAIRETATRQSLFQSAKSSEQTSPLTQ